MSIHDYTEKPVISLIVSVAFVALVTTGVMLLVTLRVNDIGLMLGGKQFFLATYSPEDSVTPYRCLYLLLASLGCGVIAALFGIAQSFLGGGKKSNE